MTERGSGSRCMILNHYTKGAVINMNEGSVTLSPRQKKKRTKTKLIIIDALIDLLSKQKSKNSHIRKL